MPLESCMILLDNSEFMRNGDYVPTRLEAQQDAANLLVGAKTQSHPESTVGVSAGTELLASPTDDVGKILSALNGVPLQSKSMDVAASVQVASLALKHRRNKNGAQRIVLFVGSPLVNIENRILSKAGRQLKKNNVAIDVVALGELEENEPKLKELVDAANGRSEDGAERTCHLVTIPAGVLPSDVLASSPIVHGGAGAAGYGGGPGVSSPGGAGGPGDASAGGGGGDLPFAEFGGVDPNMDPELAMALRVSMEEERARQERAAAAAAEAAPANETKTEDAEMEDASSDATAPRASTDAPPATSSDAPPAATAAPDLGLSEEEALLQQALAMSMNENNEGGAEAAAASEEAKPSQDETQDQAKPSSAETQMETDDVDDEDAAMQMALQMSMQTEEPSSSSSEEQKTDGQPQQQFQDPQFVSQLLGSLPGVDPNDPAIQSALRNLNEGDNKDDKKGSDSKKEGDDK
mmetsp:Transcript_9712/g.14910  ORF Transcript_9712/g.14910 Transcript_9712/m.14910 type:complete len:465 (+) Transcript_9712:221-1615(+)